MARQTHSLKAAMFAVDEAGEQRRSWSTFPPSRRKKEPFVFFIHCLCELQDKEECSLHMEMWSPPLHLLHLYPLTHPHPPGLSLAPVWRRQLWVGGSWLSEQHSWGEVTLLIPKVWVQQTPRPPFASPPLHPGTPTASVWRSPSWSGLTGMLWYQRWGPHMFPHTPASRTF